VPQGVLGTGFRLLGPKSRVLGLSSFAFHEKNRCLVHEKNEVFCIFAPQGVLGTGFRPLGPKSQVLGLPGFAFLPPGARSRVSRRWASLFF